MMGMTVNLFILVVEFVLLPSYEAVQLENS